MFKYKSKNLPLPLVTFFVLTQIFITIASEGVQHKVIITHHVSTQLELKDHWSTRE